MRYLSGRALNERVGYEIRENVVWLTYRQEIVSGDYPTRSPH
jgi:hypothetical protein